MAPAAAAAASSGSAAFSCPTLSRVPAHSSTLFSFFSRSRAPRYFLQPQPQLALMMGGLHIVRAESSVDEATPPADDPPPPPPKQSVLEALDFSAVRSQDDAQLLDDARYATNMGEKMSREQYAALRRKIGGTYRDFFKDSIEVEGEFVDEGWVDKSCRFCKKDTASEARTVDKFGRYAHISCLDNSKSKSGNFFTRLFGM
ncbi:hypothetical protein GOP47_0004434 [Adiantum capillus-veneris]|uniref:Uncharacterized protein n=1 Tax=Adiantum capillus-veneris TaxID=13818 RepID=A0A9D4ZPM1_ADICA|nr:hypothetical protein GOP47_0003668 [Adiantum capillus-veneris]KAI5081251.1 hypothetical protein GOP47_0004434 [Adiantum capillus-veneris]